MMFLIKKLARALLMLFIWGLAGGVFGAVLVSMRHMLGDLGFEGWYPLLIGTCAAAMTVAALYSAMFVALVGAAAGVLASIAYLMLYSQVVDLLIISAVAAGAGLIAGLFFNRGPQANARAFGVTMTGLLAGAGAGLTIAIALQLYTQTIDPMVVVAGVVALVGTLFQLNHRWLEYGCSGWPWTRLGGPLVAAWIAGIVGIGVWLMVGSAATELNWNISGRFDYLLEQIPLGVMGGAVGGAVTGLLLELLGFGLAEERHDI